MERQITDEKIEQFRMAMYEDEKQSSTIRKYVRDIRKLQEFLQGRDLDKEMFILYKAYLKDSGRYKTRSINSFLAAVNHFCEKMGWDELRIKTIRVQEEAFCPENKDLSKKEYQQLIRTAEQSGNEKLALVMQTIGSTGIRVSELQYITVESLRQGMAEIYNKGKVRRILYPSKLCRVLMKYTKKHGIKSGAVFCTRTGKPLHRTTVWRMMKQLCEKAGVDKEKVFPHNLRHLFAKCFYQIKKNIAKLADVLGHSNIETTRIYIRSTGEEHKRQLDQMEMVLAT